MKTAVADLWGLEPADARVVTTNGYVAKSGELVMGAGCALEAKERWPDVPKLFGDKVARLGNHVHVLTPASFGGETPLVSFPTKPALGPTGEPGFRVGSDIKLIRRSAAQLVAVANAFEWRSVVLPQPGTGMGGLSWEAVRPYLEYLLDDRFTVVSFA